MYDEEDRYKCARCNRAFDLQTERDFHEACDYHCPECGKSTDVELTVQNMHKLCCYCEAWHKDARSMLCD